MKAELLSYSRWRGLFPGVSLEGSTVRPDNDGNTPVYGSQVAPRDILKGTIAVPSAALPMVEHCASRPYM